MVIDGPTRAHAERLAAERREEIAEQERKAAEAAAELAKAQDWTHPDGNEAKKWKEKQRLTAARKRGKADAVKWLPTASLDQLREAVRATHCQSWEAMNAAFSKLGIVKTWESLRQMFRRDEIIQYTSAVKSQIGFYIHEAKKFTNELRNL